MKMEIPGYESAHSVSGFTLSYDDFGTGDVPVIFLHGFPFNRTMWKPQIEFLKSSHRVIAPDLRGFGESKDEETPLSISLFTDDLIQFMDSLKIDKAILCGLSMGGYIALAAQQKFPDRFEALILCDTQCIADTPEAKEKRLDTIKQIKAKGPEEFNEKFIKSVFYEDSLKTKPELVKELSAVVYTNSEHILTAGLTALANRTETCSTLKDIEIPTLILCGSDDAVTPLKQSEAMHKEISASVLVVIHRAGHVSNLEQPDIFNQHLLDFLASLNGIGLENFTV